MEPSGALVSRVMIDSDPVSENSKKPDHGLMAFEERPESFDWECFVCDLARAMKRHGFSVGFPRESSSSVVFIYEDVKRLLHGKQDLSKPKWIQHYFGKNIDLDQLKRDCEECLRGEKGVKTFAPRYCSNYLREDDIKTSENEGALSRALMEELSKVVSEQSALLSSRPGKPSSTNEFREVVFLRVEKSFYIALKGKEFPGIPCRLGFDCMRFLLLNQKVEVSASEIDDFCKDPNVKLGKRIQDLPSNLTIDGGIVGNFHFDQRTEKEIMDAIEVYKGKFEATTAQDLRLQIEEKIDQLEQYLESGTAHFNKRREFSRDQQRISRRVSRRIKTALDYLRNCNSDELVALADHLDHRIKRGKIFTYNPDPNDPIQWVLS